MGWGVTIACFTPATMMAQASISNFPPRLGILCASKPVTPKGTREEQGRNKVSLSWITEGKD